MGSRSVSSVRERRISCGCGASRPSKTSAWPCSRSSGRTTNSGCWRSTTIGVQPKCDAISTGWTRPRRSDYRQTTVQEPWDATADRPVDDRRPVRDHPPDGRWPTPVASDRLQDAKILGLAAFDFPNGMLLLTEAGSTRRASIHVVEGRRQLREHDPGGLDVMNANLNAFETALRQENHTLKRALTDPRFFSGIGNAYPDEILHAARLSPFALTQNAARRCRAALRRGPRDADPMADPAARRGWRWLPRKSHGLPPGHGRSRPVPPALPDVRSPVQRIVYGANEANYCAECQTGGKVLADRALSRLLKQDWPRTLR